MSVGRTNDSSANARAKFLVNTLLRLDEPAAVATMALGAPTPEMPVPYNAPARWRKPYATAPRYPAVPKTATFFFSKGLAADPLLNDEVDIVIENPWQLLMIIAARSRIDGMMRETNVIVTGIDCGEL